LAFRRVHFSVRVRCGGPLEISSALMVLAKLFIRADGEEDLET
jgi:hypothetical protein